jgi:hypothetical protein
MGQRGVAHSSAGQLLPQHVLGILDATVRHSGFQRDRHLAPLARPLNAQPARRQF